MARDILGHIDCPTCGTKGGMRVTQDRNGAPFGYCEANCSQQLRIGGDSQRVAAFVARYPWAAGKPIEAAPPPVSAPAPVPVAQTKPTPPEPPKAKPKASVGPFDFLMGKQ